VGLRTTELEKEKKELLSARSALLEIARRDALTGLLNRSAILDQLETLCQLRSPRTLPLAIIMADLDCFKKINDTHGHLAGDAVLRECAARMRNVTRECDLVGRYGGEELLIVMVGVPLELATARIEAIRMAIGATPILYDSVELFVTCSFGVAWLYEGEGRVEDLLSLADAALYRAKRNGRNRVEYGLPPDFDSAAPLYVEAQTIQ
jgi:diguanylate cyclase (GGDEF)-like protein